MLNDLYLLQHVIYLYNVCFNSKIAKTKTVYYFFTTKNYIATKKLLKCLYLNKIMIFYFFVSALMQVTQSMLSAPGGSSTVCSALHLFKFVMVPALF